MKLDVIHTYLVNNPKKILTFSLVLISLLALGIKDLQPSFNHKAWFNQNDPAVAKYDSFSQIFGNDDFITIVIKTKDSALSDKNLNLIKDITEQAAKVPNVLRVESLSNYEFIETVGDQINILPFLELTGDSGLTQRIEKAKSDKELWGTLISEDQRTTLVNIRIQEMEQGAQAYENAEKVVKEIVTNIPAGAFKDVKIGGTVPLNNSLSSSSLKDIQVLMPFAILVIILTILVIFRSFKVAAILLTELIIAIAGTMGFLGWIGVKISPIISMIPIIIASIALADSIHIVQAMRRNPYGHTNLKDKLLSALKKVTKPSILTTVTTAFGFISLYFSEIKPISDLGIGGSVGVIIAWFTSMFVVTSLIIITNANLSQREDKKLSTQIPNFIYRNRVYIFFAFVIASLFSLNFAVKNQVNSNMIRYFKEGEPIRVANERIRDIFGGYSSAEILIDTQKADGIKDPELLQKIEAFSEELAGLKHIVRVDSVLSILKKINNAIGGEGEVLPDTSGKIAESLLLYEISRPSSNTFNNWYGQDYSKARIKALWDVEDSKMVNRMIAKVAALLKKHDLPGEVTGKSKLLAGLDDYIVNTFVVSFSTTFFLIAVVMFLLTRSPILAFISFIPNIMPIFAGMWVLYLLGGVIDVGVVLFGAITIGIAIDDTIFFLTDYSQQLNKGHSPTRSIKEALISSGESLFHTSSVLVLGFLCFIFGDFIPNQNFGIITAFVLTYALVCDLVVLPVSLHLVQDLKIATTGLSNFWRLRNNPAAAWAAVRVKRKNSPKE